MEAIRDRYKIIWMGTVCGVSVCLSVAKADCLTAPLLRGCREHKYSHVSPSIEYNLLNHHVFKHTLPGQS